MSILNPKQLAICSWSLHPETPGQLIAELEKIGLKRIQLGMHPLCYKKDKWGNTEAVLHKAGVEVVSGMFGTVGENYKTPETIRKTGGIVPDEHWNENWSIAQAVAEKSAEMGLKRVSFHAGFIPEDKNDPTTERLIDRVRKIADLFGAKGMELLCETGQESAPTLLAFLKNVDRKNLRVNFDPANMLLYRKGDPIESLKMLMPHVSQVHIKDAIKSDSDGVWGREVPIGDGQVDWPAFMQVLADADYTGDLVIEREAGDKRVEDIRTAIKRMKQAMDAD